MRATFRQTQSCSYCLQKRGKHCWHCASQSPTTRDDAVPATELAIAELDAGFFRLRFDGLTPEEKKHLRMMAELQPEARRSGDIAHILKKEVQSVALTRATLIGYGMIYSPSHGQNSFTVSLFDGYVKRVVPALPE